MTIRAEEIKIKSDESGFELHVYADMGDSDGIIINIHAVAVDLYNEVVKNIGPWITEGMEAEREYRTGISGDPLLQGMLNLIKGDLEDEEVLEGRVEAYLSGIDLARKFAKENP